MSELNQFNEFPIFEAFKVDSNHIYYKCPTCFTKYKKDGTPYSSAKPVVHKHGSCGDLSNRIEHRSHHKTWNFPNNKKCYESCNISITNNTLRT